MIDGKNFAKMYWGKKMSLDNIDRNYVNCCKNYLRSWIQKYDAQDYQISEEVMEELIFSNGKGLGTLQTAFKRVIEQAKEDDIEIIDVSFAKQVLENLE